MLLLALGLGGLLAWPQLSQTWRYWPQARRATQGYADKVAIGNIPFSTQLRHLLWPTTEPIDGVFGTEACTFLGWPALLLLPWAHAGFWWSVLLVSSLLALGRQTPLFRWLSPMLLRIPARFCYFVALALAFLSLDGLTHRPLDWTLVTLGVLLQAGSLVLVCPRLWPMLPYCQRWARPGDLWTAPLITALSATVGSARVSGLPYPYRTGQITQLHTLGYNGGSQAAWMARFRQDPNPNGSGAHDWFALNEDGPLLDWYGVRYAYTFRPLRGKWRPTAVPHLYENTHAWSRRSWKEVATRYEPVSAA